MTLTAKSLAALIFAAACCASANDGWTPLFNGKDLDGWTPKIKGYPAGENFANTFRVEDGLIKVRYDEYGGAFKNRFGHLFYKTPFTNYILRIEYRFVGEQLPDGPGWAKRNSGVMVHGQSPESMRKDQDFPVSIEVQFLGGLGSGNRTTANLCTPGTNVERDGALYTPHGLSSTSKTYHGDQWVTVEVEARGSQTIIHRIDGVTVLQYDKPQYDPKDGDAKRLIEANGGNVLIEGGSISLQSESHPVDFRKVEIKPLKP
ncbi:MAG: DUF1080 domain-containing protein [Kiritimatiellae bacterium]|jgi:hypothetical protein|nr:DUF1080 domain-containing protein [Kiritimatiellia bacterium]MDD2347366.1 DUF1080 domain-containing protein [Kiritimatiellia bacterium]MDD3584466.1 DUF1080 domain-containing protein [Kiritimatiellia bacterium]HHU13560.1 DUF1080 domain-containing protein [Lentisphaerota bacterium]HON48397.1 DUF1080 domain-containing protein [Kiritimatiellia bacterium]